jgi:UDP-N-acetylmuramyl pentapeptide synthase
MKVFLRKSVLYIITALAKKIIKKHKPYIIAITGNQGKTSTKDNIAAVLGNYNIVASRKSFNTE